VTPADGAEFADHFGSAGMLAPTLEAMVVDPLTNKPVPPTKQGELWLRGPSIMKGINNNTQNVYPLKRCMYFFFVTLTIIFYYLFFS